VVYQLSRHDPITYFETKYNVKIKVLFRIAKLMRKPNGFNKVTQGKCKKKKKKVCPVEKISASCITQIEINSIKLFSIIFLGASSV